MKSNLREPTGARGRAAWAAAAGLLLVASPAAQGVGLFSSDGAAGDGFGSAVSVSGTSGLVGAPTWFQAPPNTAIYGSAYIFRNLDTAIGGVSEDAKLDDNESTDDGFGSALSLSGTTALVGAGSDTVGFNGGQGSAYIFRNMGTATNTVVPDAKLTASDGQSGDVLGSAVSLSGPIGLVGARNDDLSGEFSDDGSAYVFRNLDTATGSINESAKLTASNGAPNDSFGFAVSLSGNIGLVGAPNYDNIPGFDTVNGAAYVFRNLDTATGVVTEQVRLASSDSDLGDFFGFAVSLSGSLGLVGAYLDSIDANVGQGSAYVFDNLDTATGVVNERAKLVASDGETFGLFGYSVSLSGQTALVGSAYNTVGANTQQGSAYLFCNLDTALGEVNETVKLTATDGTAGDFFGYAVSLDGDNFLVGENGTAQGHVLAGSVSSMTTLDTGSTLRSISGLSFISRTNWIVGESSDANQVTLRIGDAATVTNLGTAVHVGRNAGADSNALIIEGRLTTGRINVGATGNTGNSLQVPVSGTLAFVIGATNTNSAVGGPGTAVFNGHFDFDLTQAATNAGATWPIVANTLNVTYGTNFQVSGFTGTPGGTWTNATNGVTYVFSPSTGLLTVAGSPGGGYASWVAYWQGVNPGFTNTAGADDPDGDGLANSAEFAFDGNPLAGSSSRFTVAKSGPGAVFQYVARQDPPGGVTYAVQSTTNLAAGPWTNAVGLSISNAADQTGINLTNDYVRREFVIPGADRAFFRVAAQF